MPVFRRYASTQGLGAKTAVGQPRKAYYPALTTRSEVCFTMQVNAAAAPDRVQQRSLLWSTVGLAMLVLVAVIALGALRQVNDSDRWVDHTREVITAPSMLLRT